MTLCLVLQMLPVQSIAYAADEGETLTDEQVVQLQDDEETDVVVQLQGDEETDAVVQLQDDEVTDVVVQEDEPEEPTPALDPEPVVEEEPADVAAPVDDEPAPDPEPDPEPTQESAPEATPETQPEPTLEPAPALEPAKIAIKSDVLEADGTVKATVEVEGDLPSDATLALLELDADAAAKLAGEANDVRFAYDVMIVSEGKEWHAKDADAKYMVRVTRPEGMDELPEDLVLTHYRDVTVAKGDVATEPLTLDADALDALLVRIADNDDTLKAEVRTVGAENPDDAIILTDDALIEFELTGLSPIVATTPKPVEEEPDEKLEEEPEVKPAPIVMAPSTRAAATGNEGEGEINGLTYNWSIKWNMADAEGANLDVDDSTLILHPTDWNITSVTLQAKMTVNSIPGQEPGVIPAGAVKFVLPATVFYGWDKAVYDDIVIDAGGVDNERVGGYEELIEGGDKAFKWEIDPNDPDKLIITNWRALSGADTMSLTVLYEVDPLRVDGGHPKTPNLVTGAITKWWMTPGYDGPSFHEDKEAYLAGIGYEKYYQKELPGSFQIDVNGNGTFGEDGDITTNAKLDIAMMTRAVGSGHVTNMKKAPNGGTFTTWQSSWGPKPDDADDYVYVLWNVGYGRGYRNGTSNPWNSWNATQGWQATISLAEQGNEVNIDMPDGTTRTFTGAVVGMLGNPNNASNNYPNQPNNQYDWWHWAGNVNNIANGKQSSQWRYVSLNGYGGKNAFMQFREGTGGIWGQMAGTNVAVLMRYPVGIIDAVREAHPDDPNYLSTTGFDVPGVFHINEHWDSNYDLDRDLPPATVNFKINDDSSRGVFSKTREQPSKVGAQTYMLLQKDDVDLGSGPTLGGTSGNGHSWAMTWDGRSGVNGSELLGQHIEITDTANSVLYSSARYNWQWKPENAEDPLLGHQELSGDNGDYSITRFYVNLDEFEGAYLENLGVWQVAANASTQYDKYAPVEVWVRKKGQADFEQIYTLVTSKSSGGGKVATMKDMSGNTINSSNWKYPLPDDVVQIKLVHDSADPFLRCVLKLRVEMTLHPTEHVLSIIKKHVEKGKETLIKDVTRYDVTPLETPTVPGAFEYHGTNEGEATASSEAVCIRLTSASSGVELTKESNTPALTDADQLAAKAQGKHFSYVKIMASGYTGFEEDMLDSNGFGAKYRMLEGTFYDLLPKGTSVREGSVKMAFSSYGNFSGFSIARYKEFDSMCTTFGTKQIPSSMFDVSTEADPVTGNTMLRVDYNIDNDTFRNIRSFGNYYIVLVFILDNPLDNIETYGRMTENDCAFVNTAEDAAYPRTGSQSSLTNAKLTFEDSFESIAQSNDIARFAKNTITWPPPTYSETTFTKLVRPVETYEGEDIASIDELRDASKFAESTEVTPGNDYEYRLLYAVDTDTKADNIVIYDVLDSGVENGQVVRDTEWHGTFAGLDIDSTGLSSKPNDSDASATLAPVVYYSTTVNERTSRNGSYLDLTNEENWSTTAPADLSQVTAFAIDCRKDSKGNSFKLGNDQSLIAMVRMHAPEGEKIPEGEGLKAVNGALIDVISYDSGGYAFPDKLVSETEVTLRDVDVKLVKDSDPMTGTPDARTMVKEDGTGKIIYRLTVTNDNPYDITDVVVTDPVPAGLTVTDVKVALNGAEEPTDASSTDSFSYDEADGTYTFTIDNQWPGEDNATAIYMYCDVDTLLSHTDDDDQEVAQVPFRNYDNTATLVEANTKIINEDTDTMYHRAETATVVVEKEWEGNENHPTSLGVHLTGTADYEKRTIDDGGVATTEEAQATWPESGSTDGDATLSADTNPSWTHTYTDLPKYFIDDENTDFDLPTTWGAYEWTVTEDPIDGYRGNVAKAVDGNTTTFTLNNVYDPTSMDVDFLKVGQRPTDKSKYDPLAGAEFKLFSDEACGTVLKDLDGEDLVAVTDDDGKGLFEGVPFTSDPRETQKKEGGKVTAYVFTTTDTYYMKETDAPDGWLENETVYAVTITKVFTVPTDGAKPTVTTSFTMAVKTADPDTGALVEPTSEAGKYTIKDELAFGDLEIVKSLAEWEGSSANATFEFDVTATIGDELVYSNATAIHFKGPGTQSVVLKHIPAGAKVTVTESYSGSTYVLDETVGPATQEKTIAADDVVQVKFDNDYTVNRRGGYGVTNQFTLDHIGQGEEDQSKWSHIIVEDSSAQQPDDGDGTSSDDTNQGTDDNTQTGDDSGSQGGNE